VAISTEASIKKMMAPGAFAIISPLVIGFILGPEALGGFLAGATVSGVLMGMFQNNAGGAWDNAKKSFEKGVEINGEVFYKKSEPHKASVTGDTVGDPFKDTSGPSMNILIKLMSIVSLVIAPTLAQIHGHGTEAATAAAQKNITITLTKGTATDANETNVVMDVKEVPAETKFKPLIDALKADKLIEGNNFSIEARDGILTVNGEVLDETISGKYKPFFNGLSNFDLKIKEN
jgi:K(+)-stimulated pyrophosphate-energized sodium pump